MVIDTVSSQCIEEWKKNKRKNRNNGPDKGETLSQLRSRIVTLNVALLKRLREKNSLLNRGIPCNILLNKEDILSFAGKIMELKEKEIGKNIIQHGGNHSVTRNRQIQFPGLTIIY